MSVLIWENPFDIQEGAGVGRLGRHDVGHVMRRNGETDWYYCMLDCRPRNLEYDGHRKTSAEAKKAVEDTVLEWITQAGLTVPVGSQEDAA